MRLLSKQAAARTIEVDIHPLQARIRLPERLLVNEIACRGSRELEVKHIAWVGHITAHVCRMGCLQESLMNKFLIILHNAGFEPSGKLALTFVT